MASNTANLDLVLQYALLVAGESDEHFDRQLGPIHLIKYVYLGDVAFAERHHGETFTGIEWKFYKFGPWSQAVNERIPVALAAIGADSKVFPSDYEGKEDWLRWSIRDDGLLATREHQLPPEIAMSLRKDIRRFGKDTPSLLDYVYKTAPMLAAAPNELLDFSIARVAPKQPQRELVLKMDSVSAKRKKVFKERMRTLQEKIESSTHDRSALVNPIKSPPSEDLFQKVTDWLDGLAGEQLAQKQVTAEFSSDVWKSNARKGEDVP